MIPLKIVFNVSRFKLALNWNRFLAQLRHGLNSLNSDSDHLLDSKIKKNTQEGTEWLAEYSDTIVEIIKWQVCIIGPRIKTKIKTLFLNQIIKELRELFLSIFGFYIKFAESVRTRKLWNRKTRFRLKLGLWIVQ